MRKRCQCSVHIKRTLMSATEPIPALSNSESDISGGIARLGVTPKSLETQFSLKMEINPKLLLLTPTAGSRFANTIQFRGEF